MWTKVAEPYPYNLASFIAAFRSCAAGWATSAPSIELLSRQALQRATRTHSAHHAAAKKEHPPQSAP
eukprot:14318448-Heterocapsa_arctica.AAC.1